MSSALRGQPCRHGLHGEKRVREIATEVAREFRDDLPTPPLTATPTIIFA